jgi:hypothetical protein
MSTDSSCNGFSEKFYLVVIECTEDNRSLLRMWDLHLRSTPVSLGKSTLFFVYSDRPALQESIHTQVENFRPFLF